LTSSVSGRKVICEDFVKIVEELNPEVIAGTASSAIAWAAWVAEKLGKPMVYIRKKGKDYGKENLIEGGDISGKKVVVVEDLVSTGGSSMNAVEACRDAGAEVIAMAAIFTYEFEKAKKKFEEGSCKAYFLSNFTTLVKVAAENNYIDAENMALVQEWSQDPAGWGPKHGFPLGEKRN
jgi:orotate phosphoribosyltransferase